MRALTVQQPWAWAIIHGGKNVENRTQPWAYRGPLAIHAGARLSDRGIHDVRVASALRAAGHIPDDRMGEPGWIDRNLGPLVAYVPLIFGAVVGLVDLVDVHWQNSACDPAVCGRWGEASYREYGGRRRINIVHLVLDRPRAIEPVECLGRLGLWTLPPDVLEAVGR